MGGINSWVGEFGRIGRWNWMELEMGLVESIGWVDGGWMGWSWVCLGWMAVTGDGSNRMELEMIGTVESGDGIGWSWRWGW